LAGFILAQAALPVVATLIVMLQWVLLLDFLQIGLRKNG